MLKKGIGELLTGGRAVKTLAVGCVAAAMIAGAALGISAAAGTSVAAADSSESGSGLTVKTYLSDWEKYKDEYPDQVNSFASGLTDYESVDGKAHSHATMYAKLAAQENESSSEINAPWGGVYCSSCKSTASLSYIEEYGVTGLHAEWPGAANISWFDCALCHENGEPGAALTYGAGPANLFATGLLDSVPAEDAVCGQCHNGFADRYCKDAIYDSLASGEKSVDDVDPYRYGYTPEDIMKASFEDGYEWALLDEESGIPKFVGTYFTIELYQGSTHEELGVTCVDCHMGTKTNEDGEEYTSHDFSSTPLSTTDNDEMMTYCLTCHASQGISDAEGMREFIVEAEEELAALEQTFLDKEAQLYDLIVAAASDESFDQDVLDDARYSYAVADFYYRYAQGSTEELGQTVAHNPEMTRSYVEQATVMIDDAIATMNA